MMWIEDFENALNYCKPYLEPDLRDPLAQSGHVGDSFEVRSIGVTVDLEVRLNK